jgi:hypothetical protein
VEEPLVKNKQRTPTAILAHQKKPPEKKLSKKKTTFEPFLYF